VTKLIYINAFILAGVLCFICQLLLMYTKLGVPKILIIGFTFGVILTACNLMTTLTAWGGAGMIIMVVDAGEAFYVGLVAALSGNFAVIITFFGIICTLAVIAILSALVYLKINASQAEL
jgi:hypothetical protein